MREDWVTRICDRVEQHVRRTKGEGAQVICSSGISPSGPIHLGNLREIMTVHLVTEELRARGWKVKHIHIWDDFDRLRKVPNGIDPAFSAYIGQPLTDIPDPFGEYESYAMRYISQFTQGLEELQIYPNYIRQSVAYREGRYTGQIKEALIQRETIFDILEVDICMICASFKMITTGYAACGCITRRNHLEGNTAGTEESSKTKFAGL